MLYTGIALGILGGLLGIAIGAAAFIGGLLGRVSGGDISMGAAAFAMAASFVALAGTLNMRRHWGASVILDAVCAILGYAALPVYFIAPAFALGLPAVLYVAGEAVLRYRVAGKVKKAAREARAQYARTGEIEISGNNVEAEINEKNCNEFKADAEYERQDNCDAAGSNDGALNTSAQSISSAAERAMYGCDAIVDVPGNALDRAMSAGISMENESAEKVDLCVEDEKTKAEPPHENPATAAAISRGARGRQVRKRK